jgi:hypothetical protein
MKNLKQIIRTKSVNTAYNNMEPFLSYDVEYKIWFYTTGKIEWLFVSKIMSIYDSLTYTKERDKIYL